MGNGKCLLLGLICVVFVAVGCEKTYRIEVRDAVTKEPLRNIGVQVLVYDRFSSIDPRRHFPALYETHVFERQTDSSGELLIDLSNEQFLEFVKIGEWKNLKTLKSNMWVPMLNQSEIDQHVLASIRAYPNDLPATVQDVAGRPEIRWVAE